MPLPKRRHSNARTRKRRTHYKLVAPTIGACPRCGKARLSYHVCPECGYYGAGASSRMVIDMSKKTQAEETEEQEA